MDCGETAEFLATVEDETDRLTNLVDNLLDMSRIQADAVDAGAGDDARRGRPRSARELGAGARDVVVDVSESAPPVLADPALLGASSPTSSTTRSPRRKHLSGPASRPGSSATTCCFGSSIEERALVPTTGRVFHPFQRLDDARLAAVPGWDWDWPSLAGSRAMRGELTVDDTPGGGTTMIVELEACP